MPERRLSFDGKREMLAGHRSDAAIPDSPLYRRAVEIGACVTGTQGAERLAAGSGQVSAINEANSPSQREPGDRASAFRPLPSLDNKHLAHTICSGLLRPAPPH